MRSDLPLRFRSAVRAIAARDYLVQNGVPAQVVGGHADVWYTGGRSEGSYEIVLGSAQDIRLARHLLEQWKDEPIEFDGSLDEQVVPDLSCLDAGFAPDCPACGASLPLDAELRLCPACGFAVDVAQLIVEAHGPEAMDACYDSEPSSDEFLALQVDSVLCPYCDGPRNERGSCAWCGRKH